MLRGWMISGSQGKKREEAERKAKGGSSKGKAYHQAKDWRKAGLAC
jgi:hypothetical protein